MAQPPRSKDEIRLKTHHSPSLMVSLLIGLLIFLGMMLTLEGVSRSSWYNRLFPLRSLGIYHNQLEIKWFKLQDYVEANNGVDFLLLGNSMVNTGIDPDILSDEYEKLTGVRLRIFNFGVEGLTVAPNSLFARILVKKYHPRTILFVTEMRDYVAANGLDVENQLLSDEWVAAQNGSQLTLRSWLKTSSSAVQHLLPFRNWSRADFPDTFLMSLRRFGDTSASGYEADLNIGEGVDKPPDPNDPEEAANFAMFRNFSIDPKRLQDLNSILDQLYSIQLLYVTEMPLYPTYFDYFGGEKIHQQYLTTLENQVTKRGGVFLPPLDWKLIPLEDRVDNHHLNFEGAPLYSVLLAKQLAQNCKLTGVCMQPDRLSGEVE